MFSTSIPDWKNVKVVKAEGLSGLWHWERANREREREKARLKPCPSKGRNGKMKRFGTRPSTKSQHFHRYLTFMFCNFKDKTFKLLGIQSDIGLCGLCNARKDRLTQLVTSTRFAIIRLLLLRSRPALLNALLSFHRFKSLSFVKSGIAEGDFGQCTWSRASFDLHFQVRGQLSG